MSLSTSMRSKSLNFGVTVLAAFVGTIGGIYLSRSWTDHRPQSNTRNHVGHHYSPGLAFSVGDEFPPEKYVDRAGNEGNFADLLKGKKTVVLFVSLGCEPCDNLLEAWHEDMSDRLIPGTQSVICLASSTVVPEKYKTLCDSLNIVFFDYQRWLSDYSMSDFPTLIGVGEGNTITDIQFRPTARSSGKVMEDNHAKTAPRHNRGRTWRAVGKSAGLSLSSGYGGRSSGPFLLDISTT